MPDNQAAVEAGVRRRSAIDVVLTVVLTIAAFTLAVTLTSGDTLWATDIDLNPLVYAIGAYGPLVITVIGFVITVIAFVRKRTTFIYPLAAIVLSGIVWSFGSWLSVH